MEVSLMSPSLLRRTLVLSDQGSALGPFLTLDLPWRPCVQIQLHWGVMASTCEFEGMRVQSIQQVIHQATAKIYVLPGTLPSFKLGVKWQIQIKPEFQHHFICHSSKCDDILSTLWLWDLVNGLGYVPLRVSWKRCSMIPNHVDWERKNNPQSRVSKVGKNVSLVSHSSGLIKKDLKS